MPDEPKRTEQQERTDKIMERIRAELKIDYPLLKERNPDLRLVNREKKRELWLAVYLDETDLEKLREVEHVRAAIYNGKEVETFAYFNQGIREYITLLQEARWRTSVELWTAPLTIGAAIAVLLVLIMAADLFAHGSTEVPAQLWTILTAVIAFYFGRGSAGRNSDRPGRLSTDE